MPDALVEEVVFAAPRRDLEVVTTCEPRDVRFLEFADMHEVAHRYAGLIRSDAGTHESHGVGGVTLRPPGGAREGRGEHLH